MKIVKVIPLGLVPALLVLNACDGRHNPPATPLVPSPAAVAPESQTNRLTVRIPATDARFRYEGRFDFSDSNAPVVVWQASRISLDYTSDALTLLFDDANAFLTRRWTARTRSSRSGKASPSVRQRSPGSVPDVTTWNFSSAAKRTPARFAFAGLF